MSLNSALSPNVVKTALDDVYMSGFNIQEHPGYATAETAGVFNQDTADSSAVIMELFGGVGAWEQTAEEQDLPQGNPRIKNQKTFSVLKFAKSVNIPKEFFDDQKHSSYEKMVMNFATRGRTARDKNAFNIFRGAFDSVTTADGSYLVADDHTTVSGETVDNKLTAALSDSSLDTAMAMLAEQKAQDGEIDGHVASTLVVPVKLFKEACEITKSELQAGTANNDMNYYSNLYPGLQVVTSPYIGAAAGGSDTAWFLLSKTHGITRWVREGVNTDLIDFRYTDNDVYKYKGRFREVCGAMSYEGIVGSTGAA